jgi:hypothetical protein
VIYISATPNLHPWIHQSFALLQKRRAMAPSEPQTPSTSILPNGHSVNRSLQVAAAHESANDDPPATNEAFENSIFTELETAIESGEFDPQTVSEEIKDDESAQVRRSVQLGQAVMHVGPLNPIWKVSRPLPN